ncbi:MAG TPA: RluA family pseudouridine synthase [Bacteroidota bacterium]|nr:RluA family pseudouridine synthase [Bacteroidota bacterium]
MASPEFTITVPPGKTPERLDLFLTHHVENATRAKIQRAIKEGFVTLNGRALKQNHKVSPGEEIHVSLPRPPAPDVLAEEIPLDIVYEDDALLIVNKAAGMVTHPAYSNYTGTLVNALLHHSGKNLSQPEGVFPRPGIVHRLDKDTSGLMVVAKDDHTHALLSKQFSDRTIEREYWAIVWGLFTPRNSKIPREGIIDAPLGRSAADRKKIAVRDEGKRAVTAYKLLEEFEFLSLVQCKLKTGRTHQIRVHMQHIGHPVFGDPTYGGRRISFGETGKKRKDEVHELLELMPRQALHAKTIGFIHPISGKKLFFESELPEDMQSVLQIIRNTPHS